MISFSSWLTAVADPWSALGPATDVANTLPEEWRWLATGVSSLACGETGRARRLFDDEYRGAAGSRAGDRALLALGLGWLAEVRHFNLFPGGCGAGSIEIELRWNGMERATAYAARAQEARSWPAASAARSAYAWLQFAAGRMPALAIVRDSAGHPQHAMMLALQEQQCDGERDTAAAISPDAPPLVDRSIAELRAVAGERAAASQALDAAIAAYRIAGCEAGVASCLGWCGDWLAAPTTSALVRNLMIADAAFPTSELAWMIEAVEGGTDGVDTAAARAALEEALAMYERSGAARGAAAVQLRLAYLARIEGRFDDQITLADTARQRFESANDTMHAHLATAHGLLARLDARQFPEHREAAAAIGAWGAGDGSFSYALGLGLFFTRAGRQALVREGDFEKAEACFHLALSLNDALGATCRQSQTHGDFALAHQMLANRRRSRTHMDEAIDILLRTTTRTGTVPGLAGQRAALLVQQSYREALDHRDAAGMERAVARMSRVDPSAHDLASLAIRSFLAETRGQAAVLIPLYKGIAERQLGNDDKAQPWFDQALAAARQPSSADADLMEAIVHATCRRYPEALAAHDRTQAKASSGLTQQLVDGMRLLSDSRGQQEAEIARRRALENALSFMVRVRAFDRAETTLRELEGLAGDHWWAADDRPWRSLSDIAEMHEGLGRYEEALAIYEQAIAALEQRRSLLSRDELKTALASDSGVQYLYFQAVRAAIRAAAVPATVEPRAFHARAFALSERARARGLLDLLAANVRRAAVEDAESANFTKWSRLMSTSELWRGMLARARSNDQPPELLETLRAKIESCERELYELERTLEQDQPRASAVLRTSAPLVTLDEAAERLPPDTALLQYMTLGDHLILWALTREGMKHPNVLDVSSSTLARSVRDFQADCARGAALAVIRDRAKALAASLLEPLGPAIDAHEQLAVSPYGELNLLPFAALEWRDDWLGRQRTLSEIPSASMLALSRTASDAPQAMLAVGNPAAMLHQPPFGAPEALPPLEHAEAEAKAVAGLYGAGALIGAAASIDAIRPELRTHRHLHFATHGVLYDDAPLLSGIALANGYVLTVQELMGLKLDADLVTVSACKSGLGERTGGEEVVGLTRGLLAAGARAVVVSLWSVVDLTTAMLMVRFQEHVREGLAAPAALRRAQEWFSRLTPSAMRQEEARLRDLVGTTLGARVSKDPRHPQHWAAFMVIGR